MAQQMLVTFIDLDCRLVARAEGAVRTEVKDWKVEGLLGEGFSAALKVVLLDPAMQLGTFDRQQAVFDSG